MAIEIWATKIKSAISNGLAPTPKFPKKSNLVGVLSFEIANLMSKLLHLWRTLSDKHLTRLRQDSISLEGIHKIISNDEAFLLGLACAEIAENLRILSNSITQLSKNCHNGDYRNFESFFDEFANSGRDSRNWVLSSKSMEIMVKKMDRFITSTAVLYKEIDQLSLMENKLKKEESTIKDQKLLDLKQKILWQKHEVKSLKKNCLWEQTFDLVISILIKSIFTTLSRVKQVFGLSKNPSFLPRSLSASAAVHPSDTQNPSFLAPLKSLKETKNSTNGFFESNSKLLKPPLTTLGASALALHYSNLIIIIEKMIKTPNLIGVDARDDLYNMLPNSIRFSLRSRLKGVGFTASDPRLAGEWREALGRILGWLSPLAHNMIKWQSERSFEQQNMVEKTNVMLLQTLFFANKEKTEAAITELLVGLNYIWRFEREMTAKALFECNNFNCFLNFQSFPSQC